MQELLCIKQEINKVKADVREIKKHTLRDNEAKQMIPPAPFSNKNDFINFDKSLLSDDNGITLLVRYI